MYGPLGPERGDWQAALVAYVIAAAHRTEKSKPLRLKDFLLRWAPRPKQSQWEQLAIFRALAAATKESQPRDDR